MGLRRLGKWALGSIAVVVGLELAMQGVARFVLHQPPLFTFDSTVGWRPRSDISITRRNVNGDSWKIRTDDHGIRGNGAWNPGATHRILILGDSFAFGEGVEIEERFDSIMHGRHTNWSFVNLGVMGYGTDQELLAGAEAMKQLSNGDAVILLLCGNDVFDVLRKEQSGRPKPWVSMEGDMPRWHPPDDGIWIRVRNRSYIVARLTAASERPISTYAPSEVGEGMAIVKALIRETASSLTSRGIFFVIAYHQLHFITDVGIRENDLRIWLLELCQSGGVSCVDLDSVLQRENNVALKDGHWNRIGHSIVAKALEVEVDRLFLGHAGRREQLLKLQEDVSE